ncbi:hypothetical protein PXK01_19190 [Phaeobacter sp. PT47_59]|uniref:hypothetical protein n=1 Tax=Phaeobacter sp. PT47_59 TaxID=3029979 RepID=UPI0023809F77|nr:hypothetical protein [Phaeobacter sp. PT47_59]MDE4176285.1 hypothetical protein [Phaeobacter sp. PT47_59]
MADVILSNPLIDDAKDPSMVILPSGEKIVTFAWNDGTGFAIWMQRFDAAGATISLERVSTGTVNHNALPKIAVDENDTVAIIWEATDGGLEARYWDLLTTSFPGDVFSFGHRDPGTNAPLNAVKDHSIVANDGGGFTAVWVSSVVDGSGYAVVAQDLQPGGTSGDPFVVNTGYSGSQDTPDVLMLGNGSMLVTWASPNGTGGQDANDGIFGQIYQPDPSGSGSWILQGAEFHINSTVNYVQSAPQAVDLGNGEVLVAWLSETVGIQFQRFDYSDPYHPGETVGVEGTFDWQMSGTANLILDEAVALDSDSVAVMWRHKTTGNLFVQTFDLNGNPLTDHVEIDTTNTSTNGAKFIAELDLLPSGNLLVTVENYSGDIFTHEVDATPTYVNYTMDGGDPSVVVLTSGERLVTFTDVEAGQSVIKVIRFPADGSDPLAPQTISTSAIGNKANPKIATIGNKVMAIWERQDGELVARLLNDQGVAEGSEVPFGRWDQSGLPDRNIIDHTLVDLGNGQAVLVWSENHFRDGPDNTQTDIVAQRVQISSSGQLELVDSTPFKVSEGVSGNFEEADVANLGNGGFVVTWTEWPSSQVLTRVYSLDAGGQLVAETPPFDINTTVNTTVAQVDAPHIVALEDGGYYAVWISYDEAMRFQRFDASGEEVSSGSFEQAQETDHGAVMEVVALEDGGIAVMWRDDNAVYGSSNVYVQSYDLDGFPLTEATLIVSGNDNDAIGDLDQLPDGRLVVTWEHQGAIETQIIGAPPAAGLPTELVPTMLEAADPSYVVMANGERILVFTSEDVDGHGIWVQHYSADGVPDQPITKINQNESHFSYANPEIADVGGVPVVIWEDYDGGLVGRQLGSDGHPVGSEFLIGARDDQNNNAPLFAASDHEVTALGDDKFVVVWTTSLEDGANTGVKAELFDLDPSGASSPVSLDEMIVNTTTLSNQRIPSVTALSDSRFVVTWESGRGADVIDSNGGIFGQIVDVGLVGGTGPGTEMTPFSAEFHVNTTTNSVQEASQVVVLNDDGDFLVTWFSEQVGIQAQRLDATGEVEGTEISFDWDLSGTNYITFDQAIALEGGGVALMWRNEASDHLFVQSFDLLGNPLNDHVEIDTSIGSSGDGFIAELDQLDNGRLIVTWEIRGTGNMESIVLAVPPSVETQAMAKQSLPNDAMQLASALAETFAGVADVFELVPLEVPVGVSEYDVLPMREALLAEAGNLTEKGALTLSDHATGIFYGEGYHWPDDLL